MLAGGAPFAKPPPSHACFLLQSGVGGGGPWDFLCRWSLCGGGRWVAVALVGDRHPGLDVDDSGARRNRGGGDGEREGQEPGAV